MNKGAIIFLVVVTVTGVVSVWFKVNQPLRIDDSDRDYFNKELPLILPNLESITPMDNLTKGMTLTCNFTVSSMADEELVIPLDLKLFAIINSKGQEINPQEAGFYYSYDSNVFVLGSFRTLSFLVTLEISEDVEVGEYQLYVRTGNWEETHVSGATLNFKVVDSS